MTQNRREEIEEQYNKWSIIKGGITSYPSEQDKINFWLTLLDKELEKYKEELECNMLTCWSGLCRPLYEPAPAYSPQTEECDVHTGRYSKNIKAGDIIKICSECSIKAFPPSPNSGEKEEQVCPMSHSSMPKFCEQNESGKCKMCRRTMTPSTKEDWEIRYYDFIIKFLQTETAKEVVYDFIKEVSASTRLAERERVWNWAVDNGITHKECFVKLRNFLQDNSNK